MKLQFIYCSFVGIENEKSFLFLFCWYVLKIELFFTILEKFATNQLNGFVANKPRKLKEKHNRLPQIEEFLKIRKTITTNHVFHSKLFVLFLFLEKNVLFCSINRIKIKILLFKI